MHVSVSRSAYTYDVGTERETVWSVGSQGRFVVCYLKRRNLFPNPTHLPFSELLPLTVDIVGDTRPVHMYRPEICMALGWPIKIEHSGVIFNVFFLLLLIQKVHRDRLESEQGGCLSYSFFQHLLWYCRRRWQRVNNAGPYGMKLNDIKAGPAASKKLLGAGPIRVIFFFYKSCIFQDNSRSQKCARRFLSHW